MSCRELDGFFPRRDALEEFILTPEQAAEAARIRDILMGAAAAELGQIARLLASKSNRELFGQTEFQVRGMVHDLAARAFDAALAERKNVCSSL